MNSVWSRSIEAVKGLWTRLSTPNRTAPIPDHDQVQMPAPTPEEARKIFRAALTEYVSNGWHIEIENEFDAVISKKRPFRWFVKLIIFLILLLIFLPLAFFYLIIVLIRALTAKPRTVRIYIDPDGQIQID